MISLVTVIPAAVITNRQRNQLKLRKPTCSLEDYQSREEIAQLRPQAVTESYSVII